MGDFLLIEIPLEQGLFFLVPGLRTSSSAARSILQGGLILRNHRLNTLSDQALGLQAFGFRQGLCSEIC